MFHSVWSHFNYRRTSGHLLAEAYCNIEQNGQWLHELYTAICSHIIFEFFPNHRSNLRLVLLIKLVNRNVSDDFLVGADF
jgi:hypothetical protein